MGNSEIQNEHDSWSNAYLLHNQFYEEDITYKWNIDIIWGWIYLYLQLSA
jgi:hypothetical protein